MNQIHQTLEYILHSIVPIDPSLITITSQESNGVLVLEVSAPPETIGQIIGKQGKIIKAIRQILNLSFPETRYSLNIKN